MTDVAAGRLVRRLDDVFEAVSPSWRAVTETFRSSAAGRSLAGFVDARVVGGAPVYPSEPLRALTLTPLESVRVVIVGQDPYHGPGQAEGLAYSVASGVRPPPSLRNIFKELQRDLGMPAPASGSLRTWAEQGVLLLNTSLTVEDGLPGSHAGRGWEGLTDTLLLAVAQQAGPIAYLLWGAAAQAKAAKGGPVREGSVHRVWRCNHPSPLSALRGPAPFIGCGHFGASARFLDEAGSSIDWLLPAPGESGVRESRDSGRFRL